MRDRDSLSDKELDRKITDIVENMTESKIRLRYKTSTDSYVTSYNKNDHLIVIGHSGGVKKYTLLNHELGHILGKTPVKWVNSIIRGWSTDMCDGKISKSRYFTDIKELYWNCYNTIEDQRIEYLMGKLWLGNKQKFEEAKEHLSEVKSLKNQLSPYVILQGVRFSFPINTTTTFFDEAVKVLNDVEGTDYKGGLICLRKIKPYIDEYINSIVITGKGKSPLIPEERRQVGGDISNLENGICDEEFDSPVTNTDLKKELEKSKTDGSKDIENLKDKLYDNDNTGNKVLVEGNRGTVGYEEDIGETIEPIAIGFNKLFKAIMEMPKNRIGYEGEEVDIESYISNKASGSDLGRCMVDTKYVNGASILLSVDGSGSMFGTNDRMKQVRNLTATIFDSIKGVDNINFKVLVWSSNSRGVMKVTEIKSKEDTSKMTMDIDGYCFTPTHLAIDHSSRVLNSMKGRNKLLMVVTDGRAQYYCNGDYTQLRLKRLGIKAVNNALRRNPNLIGLLVSNSGVSYCEDVFGKRFINATNMDEGNGVILKEFRQLVKRSL